MMISGQLEILKTKIESIPDIDCGYANVHLVKSKDKNIIVDEHGQEYAGLTDTEGNMFYIRSVKKTKFTPLSKRAVKRYKHATPCEIVLCFRKLCGEALIEALIPKMTKGVIINAIDTDSPEIYKKETGDKTPKVDFKEWQIIKIEFTLYGVVSSVAKCIVDLCKC